jgi:iron complex outermembrane receptor protein
MSYNNQLVLTGEIDDVGDPIRQNVFKSYRAGVEFQTAFKLSNHLKINTNATFSKNKITQFDNIVYDTQYDPATYNTVSYNAIVTKFGNTNISFSPNVTIGNTITYSPLNGLDFGLITKFVGKQNLDNTSNNARIMKDYCTNNLSVSYKIKSKWANEITINLLINNLLDKKYVSNGYTYSYFYRPQGSDDKAITEKFYYPQAGINFLTGINLKF